MKAKRAANIYIREPDARICSNLLFKNLAYHPMTSLLWCY